MQSTSRFSVLLDETEFYYFVINTNDEREGRPVRRKPVDYPNRSSADLDEAIECRDRLNNLNQSTVFAVCAQIKGGDWRAYRVEV